MAMEAIVLISIESRPAQVEATGGQMNAHHVEGRLELGRY
jgi:hypothetical protein